MLDKTGTLTVGVPQISFTRTAPGVDEKEMILLAASAEQHSVHPLAVVLNSCRILRLDQSARARCPW